MVEDLVLIGGCGDGGDEAVEEAWRRREGGMLET